MKRLYVLLGTLFFCGLVGCSTDPNDTIVAETISALQDTTRQIEQIYSLLNTEVETATKNQKPMNIEKLKEAKAAAEGLKKLAERLQQIKAQTDKVRDSLTADQKAALAKKHKDGFQSAANELGLAEKKLERVMLEAEKLATAEPNKGEMKELRKALETSQKEFAVMTKRQS